MGIMGSVAPNIFARIVVEYGPLGRADCDYLGGVEEISIIDCHRF